MAAQALLEKIRYHLNANKAPVHPYVPYAGTSHYHHTERAPASLAKMPEDLGKILQTSHVLRLTVAIQIVDGRAFAEVAEEKRDAYIYQLLTVAEGAFDGATGEAIPRIRAGIIPHDTCAEELPCKCQTCNEEYLYGCRWKVHLKDRHGAELNFREVPMMQLDIEKVEGFLTMEQIWLQLPRKIERKTAPKIKPQREMETWSPAPEFPTTEESKLDQTTTATTTDDDDIFKHDARNKHHRRQPPSSFQPKASSLLLVFIIVRIVHLIVNIFIGIIQLIQILHNILLRFSRSFLLACIH